MEIEVDGPIIDRIWRQLNADHLPGRRDGKRTAHLEILETGWGMRCDIEDLLHETDDRADLLSRKNNDFDFFLNAYELKYESQYRRPSNSVSEIWGHKAMRATDIAMFVMEIERLGFSVDAEPLADALRPSLRKNKYLTNSELSVWWYKQQRHRMEPIILRARNAAPTHSASLTTQSEYRATALLGSSGAVILRVDAPKGKNGSSLKYWLSGELGRTC